MSNDNCKPTKGQSNTEMQSEIDRLNAKAESNAAKFNLKDRLTRHLLETMPRHCLYAGRWHLAEVLKMEEIPPIIEYMKSVLPSEAGLLDAYRPEMESHRESMDLKSKLDAEKAAEKLAEKPPTKAPDLDVRPVKIGS